MRIYFCLLFLFIFSLSFSRERTDSTGSKLKINGSFSINSNGIAPIPAFSLGKPAMIASFTLAKGRFSYDPQIAYGFNFRPWIIDNWVHYRLIYKPSFELRTGMDFSMFFSEYEAAEDYRKLQAQQYLTYELAVIYKFSPVSILSLMYWSDNGQDPGTIKGSFYNAVYDRADMRIGKALILSASLQLFYIDYTGSNDGLFISPKVAGSAGKIPLSLFLQATQALTSNIEPFPGFRWNAGLAYMF